MMLTRWDPFTNLLSLDREMDRVFGAVLSAPQLSAGNGQTATIPTGLTLGDLSDAGFSTNCSVGASPGESHGATT